jgi:hypothetical protein
MGNKMKIDLYKGDKRRLNEESLMFQGDVFDEFGCNKFKEIECQ